MQRYISDSIICCQPEVVLIMAQNGRNVIGRKSIIMTDNGLKRYKIFKN